MTTKKHLRWEPPHYRPHDAVEPWTRVACQESMHVLRLDAKGHLVLDAHPHLKEEVAMAEYAGTVVVNNHGERFAHPCHSALRAYQRRNVGWFSAHQSQFAQIIEGQRALHTARHENRRGALPPHRRGDRAVVAVRLTPPFRRLDRQPSKSARGGVG